MSIYLIYMIGSINIILLLSYFIYGMRTKKGYRDKQGLSTKLVELLKE